MPTTLDAPLSTVDAFQLLARQWKGQSEFMSNTAQMALLVPYQRIIGMGPVAIPWILEEMRQKPDQWFWALEMISDENPVPFEHRGDVMKMTDIWLRWGRERGFIG